MQVVTVESAPTSNLAHSEKLDLWTEARMTSLSEIMRFGEKCEALRDLAGIGDNAGSSVEAGVAQGGEIFSISFSAKS